MTPTPRQCRTCGTHIADPIANQQYCGPDCRPKRDPGQQLRRYEEDPNYEYGSGSSWRRYVLEEHGHRCADCDGTENLHAHHIIPRALGGKNTISNGVVLCPSCHRDRHAIDGSPDLADKIAAKVVEQLRATPEIFSTTNAETP